MMTPVTIATKSMSASEPSMCHAKKLVEAVRTWISTQDVAFYVPELV
jgi:hypothetical protein